jgi:hypothetical protein
MAAANSAVLKKDSNSCAMHAFVSLRKKRIKKICNSATVNLFVLRAEERGLSLEPKEFKELCIAMNSFMAYILCTVQEHNRRGNLLKKVYFSS